MHTQLQRRASLQPGAANSSRMLVADFAFRGASPDQLHDYLNSRRRKSDHCTTSNSQYYGGQANAGAKDARHRHSLAHMASVPAPPPARMLPKQPLQHQQRRSQPTLWPANHILGGGPTRFLPGLPDSNRKSSIGGPDSGSLEGGRSSGAHYYLPRSSGSGSPVGGRRVAPSEKRILKRCPQSDLGSRFQRYSGSGITTSFQLHEQSSMSGSLFGGDRMPNSNESTPSRTIEEPEIDPVYLALKQATGKYGGAGGGNSNAGSRNGSRRGSSAHNFPLLHGDCSSPSPKNLSQVSLQDSGYAEPSGSRPNLVGSTPQLDQLSTVARAQHNSANSNGFSATSHAQSNGGGPVGVVSAGRNPSGNSTNPTRRPKLSEKMKSLSLDCAEMPPPVNASMSSTMRSPFKSKPMRSARGFAASGEGLDWERSVSPTAPIQPVNRRLPLPAANGTHVVIHEYVTNSIETALFLGDRLHIVDNGDPDWLHGFKINDRLERLLTFPATCVTAIQPGEQPMKLIQNCNPEKKVRLYRDQVVFAQPDSIREDSTILIRNEHRTFVYCPLQYLMLI